MRAGDYCWGEQQIPYRVIEVDEESIKLVGVKRKIPRHRVTGYCRPGDRVLWLPLSNNWQDAIVLDEENLVIQINRTGAEVQVRSASELMSSSRRRPQ